MEARDGDEEGFEEADEVKITCDPEQVTERQEDIDDTNVKEVEEEEEAPEAQQPRDASDDAETAENQEDSGEKQEETAVEEPAASEAEQEEDTSDHPKDPEEQNEEQPEDEGAEEDNAEQAGPLTHILKCHCLILCCWDSSLKKLHYLHLNMKK